MTIREDLFGCPVTLSKTGDLNAWNETQMAFLAHAASTPDLLGKTIDSDPEFALPVICKGLFSLLLARRELADVALGCERQARTLIQNKPVTSRETAFLNALTDWNAGSPRSAAGRLQGLCSENPSDALAMKLVQAIRFVLGDAAGMRASIEPIVAALDLDHPAYGYALGCYAFTLEESGEYEHAERVGRQGVLHTPNDAWGLHAVAHVYDMTNDTKAGLNWLKNRTSAWQHCNNFRYHVWWHMALMHLDRNEIDAVFELYDQKIRHDKTDDYRDISNAASLLSRLELDGHKVSDRWEELAHLSNKRSNDGCLAFADLHYMMSLIGSGQNDGAALLLARMRKDATVQNDEMKAIIANPGLIAGEGLEAFGEGNYQQAFIHLAGCRDTMQLIGGSHAQRDVFEQITIEAALRSGHFDAAERYLVSRTHRRGGKPDRFARLRMDELARHRHGDSVKVAGLAE